MSHFYGTLSAFNCAILAHHGLTQAGVDKIGVKKRLTRPGASDILRPMQAKHRKRKE
jgi:hypothetical protein